MLAIELTGFGIPHEVCRCIDIDPPDAPGVDEVTVDSLACPVNPAEILLLAGKYASRPALPYRPGIEGVARVTAIGANVTSVNVGDKVISLGRQNWAQSLNLPASDVIAVPEQADTLQLAMLKVNPATALLMLTQYCQLKAGSWVVQNAANSGVGHALIQLAKASGWRTVNVVRREELVAPLLAAGADAVLVDGDDLGERCNAITGNDPVELAIDAIAGSATTRLANCLSDGGTVVTYGLLSGAPCQVTPDQVIFRSITLTGFWLAKYLSGMPRGKLLEQYDALGGMVADGILSTPVEATYRLEDINTALEHAARGSRSGKILLTPNGAV
ncbi:MAG: zinc-dependent alcohol dehydrogenase family protein [Granulosicoccus sp.]